MDDGTLRDRYRQLMDRDRTGTRNTSVPLETIQALAEDRLTGAERIEALDRILADPSARSEYEFLREIAAARPRPAWSSRFGLIAAAVLVLAGGGLVWRAVSNRPPEPLRGSARVVLLLPRARGTILPGDKFVWGQVAGAQGYVVEVLTGDGSVSFRTETRDTTAEFSGPQASSAVPGEAMWIVTARLGGAVEQRSMPRRIQLGR